MKEFKTVVRKQNVKYNSDNPEKQLVEEESVVVTRRTLWGLITTTDTTDITQTFGSDSKKKLGF